jgi:uncharacterized PurR-regulated membrane protein YhhQ (DUF165 family)
MLAMNEVIAILSFAVLATLVVTASRLGTTSLFVISVTFILLSNITIRIPIRVFGVEFPWALIVYSLVYFTTNLVVEFRGKNTAYRLATTNVAVQILLWGYIWASLAITPTQNGFDSYSSMNQLLGTTKQISVAALLASIGPFLGILTYSRLRQKWEEYSVKYSNSPGRLGKFIRNRMTAIVVTNKISTFVGQIVNTVLFFAIANVDYHMDKSAIIAVILSSCVVKMVIAVADIPFLILAVTLLTSRGASQLPKDLVTESSH